MRINYNLGGEISQEISTRRDYMIDNEEEDVVINDYID